jgi:hypothetical protein
MDQEAHPPATVVELHQHVPGLLQHPGGVRIGGAGDELDPAGSEREEDEHIQPLQPHRLNGEEVGREHRRCLRSQERAPAQPVTLWCRRQPRRLQQLPHRGRRDDDPELLEFAHDPLVAPGRVLARVAQHQLAQLERKWWPSRTYRAIRPPARNQTLADQEAGALLGEIEAEVAHLLGHPVASGIPRAAGQPNASARMRSEVAQILAVDGSPRLQRDRGTAPPLRPPHRSSLPPAQLTELHPLFAPPSSLAILASMGEIDPLGTRKDGLDAFLEQKVEEGYTIETRTDTHAIIARRPEGLKRFTSGVDPGRYVVEVDEDGIAKMRPAEPRRA